MLWTYIFYGKLKKSTVTTRKNLTHILNKCDGVIQKPFFAKSEETETHILI